MKKHTKFVAYALAGFIAVSAINVPSVYAEEIPTETVVDTTNNSATDTTTETPTDSTADSSTETPADSTADSSSSSTNKTTTVKKATATKKKYITVKKYKKSKKLYVKVSSAKAYKNPDTTKGKLVVAKKYKKATKLTVTGTTKYKGKSYYVVKSGKNVYLVQQSLLSKTKPKTAKPSSNKPSTKPSSNSSNSNSSSNSSSSSSNSSTSKHPIPQNNTPSGYKGPANWYGKVDKYGNSPERDIKTVKVVDGKVEYRDIDGKIKYGKCKYIWGGYSYWYTMKDRRGFWMPIENTDLVAGYWDESDINGMWNEQNMDIKG